jgi:hypothetical protein
MKVINKIFFFIILSNSAFSQIHLDSACIINLNKDTTFQIRDSSLLSNEFNQNVIPSLFYIPLEHNRAYGKYIIPFDTLAKVSGLYTLMGEKLIKPCCTCCPTAQCAPEVEFNRNATSSQASFNIRFKNVGKNYYSVSSKYKNSLITLECDTLLRGTAEISPNLIRLNFNESRIKLRIQDPYSGNIFLDISIRCITISPVRIVYMPYVRRPFKGNKLPLIIYKD